MKFCTSSASCASGGATPQTGRGQATSLVRRAITCTCSCGTALPRAAILSLSQWVTSLSARDAADLGHQLRLLDFVEVDDLHRFGAARHQQEPGEMRILDHEHAAQRQ